MAFDFKKEYKEFYMPKNKPAIVTVPKANYIAVRGKGNPNEEGGAYQQAISVLYAVAYTLRMSYKTDYKIAGFFEYVVPPLEGLRDVELVSTTVDNWDSYDTVYIGYPIWWGIAAWPVDNFVKENDFTGKTVIPFCTAATSGIGDSGNLLEEMTGTGDWKEGERFHGGASESDISSWIDSLGL